jgi:hypothetical protein
MFRFLKELKRSKIDPIHLYPGDSVIVTWRDNKTEKVLCEHKLDATQSMTVDEALIFSGEYENRKALGGMVLEEKKNV